MGRCILFGHTMQPMRGAGQYRSTMFAVCVDCGKTVEIGAADEETEAAPVLPNAFVRLEDAPKASNDV